MAKTQKLSPLVHLVVTHPSHNPGYELDGYKMPSNATPQVLIVISINNFLLSYVVHVLSSSSNLVHLLTHTN